MVNDGRNYINAVCKCGAIYKESDDLTSVKHGMCGLCILKYYLCKEHAQKVAVVTYILTNSAKPLKLSLLESVKQLCTDYTKDLTVLSGVSGVAKSEVFDYLDDPNNLKAFRIKQDLEMYLEQNGIVKLVTHLFT